MNKTILNKLRIRDLMLNALTISSGAINAISFLSLGKVFSGFMTGNIAFLGLRVAGSPAPDLVSILGTMIGFAVGVYVSSRIANSSKRTGVWPVRVTLALAISLVAHAVFLALWFGVDGHPNINATHYLLGFWAFAMGMQSVAVRTLHVDGVFTTAATATVIFLVGDLANWSETGVERKRLTGILISLFIGATAGGFMLVHAHPYAPVLPFVIDSTVVLIAATVLRKRLA